MMMRILTLSFAVAAAQAYATDVDGTGQDSKNDGRTPLVKRLLELARSSHLGGSTGFEGVYSSGDGFGANLRKGSKRLRQTGFRSPFEAALERARWAKLADPGPDPGTSTRLSSAQSQTQSLPW